ncbi:hypothetical protein EUGRSUZ_C03248 [Eucalyptus grandis]|uniref:Uncharacterized protein n=2 Tax=Eucalyptus grandis TaxID=71139 RepID=A0ACC3LID5_EUCGR|nr:hypothetical protein EUGRSUZ_C03248 [Eucalyptus grandis]
MHLRKLKIMSSSVFQILLLLVSLKLQASGAAPRLAKPNCPEKCGNITIPFPFGIGAGCFLDEWYHIICQQNNTVPILKKIGLRVLDISLPDRYDNGMIEISLPVIYSNASCGGDGRAAGVSLEGSQFVFSQMNIFTLVGCNTQAKVDTTKSAFVGCSSRCAGTNTNFSWNSACSGRDGCCQTMLPLNLQHFSVHFKEEGGHQGCKYAFLRSYYTSLYDLKLNETIPVVLEWGIANNTRSSVSLLIYLLLVSQPSGAAPRPSGAAPPQSHYCAETCGNVTIPFPFGIEAGCFLDDWYQIVCQQNMVPILKRIELRVLNISLPDEDVDGMINVSLPIIYSNASCRGDGRGARTRNIFTVVGCNARVTVKSTKSAVFGCRSKCVGANFTNSNYSACSKSEGCCQSSLPFDLQGFDVDFEEESGAEGCKYAFLGSDSNVYDLRSSDTVPGVLGWGIANDTDYALDLFKQGYYISNKSFSCTRLESLRSEGEGNIYRYRSYSVDRGEKIFVQCYCHMGYHGNAYLIGGCQGSYDCNSWCPGTCVKTGGSFRCVGGGKTKFILIGKMIF